MNSIGIAFDIVPSEYEEVLDDSRSATDVAIELGLGKAQEVASRYPQAVVIGSDTIVSLGDRQLGKPVDNADATNMLKNLRGKTCVVTTSVAVSCVALNIQLVGVDTAELKIKNLTDDEIAMYVASGLPMDKAGSIGVQDMNGLLVDEIVGDYDTVLGLSSKLVRKFLKEVQHSNPSSKQAT